MLVEQDCICVIQASQDPQVGENPSRIDLLNENDSLALAYGLTQTDVANVD